VRKPLNHKQGIALLAEKHGIPQASVEKIIHAVFKGKRGLHALPFGMGFRLRGLGTLTPDKKRYNALKKEKDKYKSKRSKTEKTD
jgi:hypothetical protein